MDSIVIARVKRYLQERLTCDPYECGAVVFNIRQLARMAGHDLNERFSRAGLGAGPEARIASEIVDRALGGGGGSASSEHHMKLMTQNWVRTTPPMGM
jgi:hypothetical protein